jgi:hypothetical protein
MANRTSPCDEDEALGLMAMSELLRVIWNTASVTQLAPFVCGNGSIGLASPHTEPGDEVWLILTCYNPIILRPH